jgi:hypothetical protein
LKNKRIVVVQNIDVTDCGDFNFFARCNGQRGFEVIDNCRKK